MVHLLVEFFQKSATVFLEIGGDGGILVKISQCRTLDLYTVVTGSLWNFCTHLRSHFITEVDGVFCVGRMPDKQMQNSSSHACLEWGCEGFVHCADCVGQLNYVIGQNVLFLSTILSHQLMVMISLTSVCRVTAPFVLCGLARLASLVVHGARSVSRVVG